MKWSIACRLGLLGWTLAACGGALGPTETAQPEAGSDVSTAGSGGTSSTEGGGGTWSSGGAAGSAGNDGSSAGSSGAGGAATGGAGGNSGAAGTAGAGGRGGAGGTAGADGSGGAGGTAGALGSDGSTFDGSTGPCTVDQDCPPPPCQSPPCPESLCVMREGVHRCVKREHPAYAQCPSYDAGYFCCVNDSECTAQPHGYCISEYHRLTCADNLMLPPPMLGNRCQYDLCSGDSDCTARPNGFCTQDFPRRCVYGPCRTNADCNRRPGGECVLGVVCEWTARRAAFCRYPNEPCRSTSDCGLSDSGGPLFCVPNDDGHGFVCKAPPPPPM